MATFIEPKFPVASKPRRAGANKPPVNHTLEDVAEEVLNGMFCHYEPPDPEHRSKSKKKPYRSILRRRGSAKQRSFSTRPDRLTRRVRWVDEIEAIAADNELSPGAMSSDGDVAGGSHRHAAAAAAAAGVLSPLESSHHSSTGCGVVQACFDAGREVGCYSSRAENNGIPPVPKMNAQQAMAVARSKSPRHNQSTPPHLLDIVFDDEGNPRYSVPPDVDQPPPPPITPPVPPPNKKEIFFPELCGVRINCLDDDLLLESTASVSPSLNENSRGPMSNQPYHRNSNKDTDDAENSILFEDDDDDNESETSDEEEEEEEMYHQSQPRYQATSTPVSQTQPKKSIRQVIHDYKDSDDEKGVDWENASAVSSTFFRRVWSRNKDNSGKAKSSLDTIREAKPSSTKPSMSQTSRYAQSTRSSSPSKDFDPVELNRSESQTKATPNIGGFLAKRNRSPSRPSTIVENSDWDDDIPIVKSGSGENVVQPESAPPPQPKAKQESPAPGEKTTFLNRRRSRSLERQSKNETPRRSFSPARSKGIARASNQEQHGVVQNSRSVDSAKHQRLPESDELQFHPAHPLVNPNIGRRLDKDDVLERQSNITAHRRGFENTDTNETTAAHLRDDALERQSMITAHRNGFEGKGRSLSRGHDATETHAELVLGHQHQRPLVESKNGNKSRILRGHKTNIKAPLQQKAPTAALREQKTSPAVPQMSHDDMLERMSSIAASRRGMEVPTAESSLQQNWTGPAKNTGPTKNLDAGKPSHVRSPFRRSRSYEQDYEPINTYQPAAVPYNYVDNDAILPDDSAAHQFMVDRRNSIYPDAQHFSYIQNTQADRSNNVVPRGSDGTQAGNDRSRQSFPAAAPYAGYATPQYHPVYGLPAQHIPPGQTMQHPMSLGQLPVMYQHPMVSNSALGVSGGPTPHWMGQDYYTFYNEGASVAEQQPSPVIDESTKAEQDLTWEERTRQAWERLRGGMAALAFDTPKEEKSAENAHDASTVQPQTVPETHSSLPQTHPPHSPGPTADMYNLVQSPSHPRENFPPPIHQPSPDMRRVSFGAPQQMIYYDNQDENQTLMSYPSYPGQTKKKKKFRGTKLVSGVFDKMKNSLGKVSLSLSSSSESNIYPIRRNSSQPSEWEVGRRHSNDQIVSSPSLPIGYTNAPQTMYTNPNASFTHDGHFQHQPQHPNHIMGSLQQQLNMNNSLQQKLNMNNSLQQQHMVSNIPQQQHHQLSMNNSLQQHRNMNNNLEQQHTHTNRIRSGQVLNVANSNGYQYDPRQNYGQSV